MSIAIKKCSDIQITQNCITAKHCQISQLGEGINQLICVLRTKIYSLLSPLVD